MLYVEWLGEGKKLQDEAKNVEGHTVQYPSDNIKVCPLS